MRILRLASCLLVSFGFCGGLSGCAERGWLRPEAPAKVQTVASVGDKALPIVAGVPGTGTTERAESEPLDPPRLSGSRISGRVFDDRGKPVPNARVRLVVGGTAAGRDSFATTDRSGAFTMHGLRAGRYYTLVAESPANGGRMSGQVEARAPRTGVRIDVGDRPASASRGASVRPVRSRRTGLDDEIGPSGVEDEEFPRALAPDGAFRRKGNIDDSGPPADEAAAREPREGQPARSRVARTSATSSSVVSRDGWETAQARGRSSPAGRPRNSSRAVMNDPRDDNEDGENPLPPALEAASREVHSGAGEERDLVEPGPLYIPDNALPVRDRASFASRDRYESDELRDDRTPGGFASRRRHGPGADFNTEDVQESVAGESKTADRGRPTWRDLSINSSQVPVDEAVGRSSVAIPARRLGDEVVLARLPREGEDPGSARRIEDENSGDVRTDRAERPALDDAGPETDGEARYRVRGAARTQDPEGPAGRRRAPRPLARARREARPVGPFCRMDTADRRVADFQLPGLDGSMVAFQDVDADVIVLDFWGSWCEHCRKSIEFERDLKERFGSDRVRVLGIACEKGKTHAERRASAAQAARQLGIDYPVLVTTMDGTCPVQKAFQVQFYPTLVVLDRSGRILHVERGATDATLGRLERAVSAALDDADEQPR